MTIDRTKIQKFIAKTSSFSDFFSSRRGLPLASFATALVRGLLSSRTTVEINGGLRQHPPSLACIEAAGGQH